MSRIDDLMNDLCPDGVPFVALQELFDMRNGYTPAKSKSEFWSGGRVPWFRMDDFRENGRILNDSLQHITESAVKGGRRFPANSLLVATSATIGEHALITVPHLSNQRFTSLTVKPVFEKHVDMKFLFYYGYVLAEWCLQNTTQSSFASVDMARFKKFRFPVPPLEVQDEIVRILDTFSALTAELEAELEARRTQYEHYREALLRPADPTATSWVTLDRIAENHDAKRKPIARGKRVPGDVPYYGASGVVDYVHDYLFDGDYLLVSEDGANLKLRSTPIAFSVSGRTWVNNHAHVLSFEDPAQQRFVEHYLNATDLTPFISGAAQPKLNKANLNRIPIPWPSEEEIRKIATSLDRLESLTSDLSSGLPAEIEARRKQYEYYRDRLLSFEEAPA